MPTFKYIRSAIESNIRNAKRLCATQGLSCSIMVKDFYQSLGIQNMVKETVWSHSIGGCFNYKVGSNDVRRHSGGIILTADEAHYLRGCIEEYGLPFKGFVPVNLKDDREGLDIETALALIEKFKDLNDEFFSLNSVIITTGCLHGNIPTYSELKETCLRLRQAGVKYITIGGSHYLGWLSLGKDLTFVDDIRIGEYALYGTVPFYPLLDKDKGLKALEVYLEVVHIYKDRKQVLLSGGQTFFDADKSELLDDNYTFVHSSTEYTILSYKREPKIGDLVKFIPNYHSLLKIIPYVERRG